MTQIHLNEGKQREFVEADDYYSAYIGGLGSGKTYGGLARALKFALQPRQGPAGPRGIIAAESYRVLDDVVIPQLAQMLGSLGIGNWERDYRSQKHTLDLPNSGKILFRSLDQPDSMRGVEVAWFYIDEGRNVRPDAWRILTGRLRQPGYKRGAWVCSTPAGYDWMYDTFHPASPNVWPNAKWYGAPTHENTSLPPEYIQGLELNYSGKWYEQEVLGHFVGVMEGSVFPEYDEHRHLVDLEYDPKLPLYTFWDFGIGDPGVCLFAQLEYRVERALDSDIEQHLPVFKFVGEISEKDWTSRDWASAVHDRLRTQMQGAVPTGNYGDPAGRKRNEVSGTSVIEDLTEAGIPLIAAPKKPQDYSIRILANMMAGDRVLVSKQHCPQLSRAFVSHHWNTREGQRTGVNPVHDWTSHYVDAARYGAASLVSFFPRVGRHLEDAAFTPQQYGFVFQQLVNREPEKWFEPSGRRRGPTFEPRAFDVREANR